MKKIVVHVLNFSIKLSNEKLIKFIGNFNEALMNYGIDSPKFIINDKHYLKPVKRIIDKTPQDSPLIENDELLLELGISDRIVFVVIGEQLGTRNPWGDANNYITVISNIFEKNIWHEICHLLGADDHYEIDTKYPHKMCKSSKCIMQYGKTEGDLCEKAVEEIKMYLESYS